MRHFLENNDYVILYNFEIDHIQRKKFISHYFPSIWF